MAYIGRKPMPLAEFEAALAQIQTYLKGESVDLDGFDSQIQWISQANVPKVHMSVAATGPKVVQIAARVADAITFSVGANPDRLKASIDLAKQHAQRGGAAAIAVWGIRQRRGPSRCRGSEKPGERPHGRLCGFSTMDKRVLNSLAEEDRKVGEALVSSYDMQSHAASGARHEAALGRRFRRSLRYRRPVRPCRPAPHGACEPGPGPRGHRRPQSQHAA